MSASIEPHLLAQVAEFVTRYGTEALEAALAAGHLFGASQRPLSRLAIKHSADYAEAGLPHALVIKLDPNARQEVNRVEARLVTGRVQVGLDFGTVGGSG